MKNYDVVIVGAGPAGGACASACAKQGLKVAMIEDYGFGGTCPLRGCNPKKVLTGAAEIVYLAQGLVGKGLKNSPQIDWKELAALRDSFVQGKKEKIQKAYADMGIETFNGRAVFKSEQEVQVGPHILAASSFVLATGITPIKLDVPGQELIASSDDFLALNDLPKSICFIGGGFISFEFASVAARAGADVSIVHRSSRVLKKFDPELSKGLVEALRESGVNIYLDCPLKSVSADDSGTRTVQAGSGSNEVTIHARMVVHGAGRKPAIESLGLEKCNVDSGPEGIKVNSFMQSVSNPRFYAVGDVASPPYALTPTGDMEGKVAAANIIKPGSLQADYLGVPQVVYTAPPLCAVGMLEQEARSKGINMKIIQEDISKWFSWSHHNQKHGGCRIIIDKDRDVIIGAHILGAGACELSNLFAMAIRLELPVQKLSSVLWAYPTKGYYFKYMI